MKSCFSVLFFLICLYGNGVYAETYKFSMLPRYFPEKLNTMVAPFVAYLKLETGLSIEYVPTQSFADFEAQIKNGMIDIGLENPVVYTKISKQHEAVAAAVEDQNGQGFRGIIITRPDSDIAHISDLKNKKIMIVSKDSTGGYLSQKLVFKENAIDLDRDCQLIVAADNRQENVIISVSIGDVDAGFIRESALHIADEFITPGSVKTMVETAWLPYWALSVKKTLPKDKKASIEAAVLKLSKGDSILKALEIVGFILSNDAEYDVMRKVID